MKCSAVCKLNVRYQVFPFHDMNTKIIHLLQCCLKILSICTTDSAWKKSFRSKWALFHRLVHQLLKLCTFISSSVHMELLFLQQNILKHPMPEADHVEKYYKVCTFLGTLLRWLIPNKILTFLFVVKHIIWLQKNPSMSETYCIL